MAAADGRMGSEEVSALAPHETDTGPYCRSEFVAKTQRNRVDADVTGFRGGELKKGRAAEGKRPVVTHVAGIHIFVCKIDCQAGRQRVSHASAKRPGAIRPTGAAKREWSDATRYACRCAKMVALASCEQKPLMMERVCSSELSFPRPIDRRRFGILWEIDVEDRRELEQFRGAHVPEHLGFVDGRDRNIFAVLRIVAVLPIYPFVKLEKIELPAFPALQQISAQVTLVGVRIDKLEEFLHGGATH
jgi:hypothetical protein